jgi:hypothetical protein
MNAGSLGIAMRRFAAIAVVLVLVPFARSPAVNSAIVADQAAGKHAGVEIVLAQGRCFNGKCF